MTKKKLSRDSKQILFFLILSLVVAVGIICCFMLWGNSRQIYNDVIREYTSGYGSNKSLEIMIGYGSSLVGMIAVFFFYLILNTKDTIEAEDIAQIQNEWSTQGKVFLIATAIFFTFEFLNNVSISLLTTVPFILMLVLFFKDREYTAYGGTLYFVLIYAEFALYQLYVYMGGSSNLSIAIALPISAGLVVILSFVKKDKRDILTCKFILLLQGVLPFILFIYLKNVFLYQGKLIAIQNPIQITVFIFTLFFVLLLINLRDLKKNWVNIEKRVTPYISGVTCIMLLAFNRFSGNTSFVPEDFRHPYENILAFSQFFEHDMGLYSEYYPFSGLFSVVHGAFFFLFGNGDASNYYLSTNIFYLCICIVIAVLLCRHVEGCYRLLVAIVFSVGSSQYFRFDYDRVVFILPIILLLTLPELIRNKNKWLMVWFLTSFLHVLYYPVYGAAVCLGFAPLGIWQFFTYVTSDELKKDIRKKKTWFCWLLCVLPAVIGFPLLLRLFMYSRIVGKQTIYEAGMSRFGQALPVDFLNVIPSDVIRRLLFYSVSFLFAAGIIWISFGLFLEFTNMRIEKRKLALDLSAKALVTLPIGIMFLVSISFVMVRLDVYYLYARGAGGVFAAVAVLVIIARRFLTGKKALWIYAFAFILMAMTSDQGFYKVDKYSKLEASYSVPENYVYMIDPSVEHLGEGFIEEESAGRIKYAMTTAAGWNKDRSYFAATKDFGEHYLTGLKGVASIEAATIKGYDVAVKTADTLLKNDAIVGRFVNSIKNYYIYHWLVCSGHYYWDTETQLFYPNQGTYSLDEIRILNNGFKFPEDVMPLEKSPSSWGQSMEELADAFEYKDKSAYSVMVEDGKLVVENAEKYLGDEMDFLYLEFEDLPNDYQLVQFDWDNEYLVTPTETIFDNLYRRNYNPGMYVVATWQDDMGAYYGMTCKMDKGKLLVPLGMGNGWLLSNHSKVEFYVMKDGNMIEVPSLKNIEFLKLREIQIEE